MANKLIQHGGAAAATAAGGPIAGAAWEIGYPIVENWLTGGSGQDKAAAQQQAGMQQAKDQYAAYRPVAQQARQQATQQQLSAYNGAANAMNLMYGTAYDPRNYAPDLGKNPLLTGSGSSGQGGTGQPSPQSIKQDANAFYQQQKQSDRITPGDIALNVGVPGAALTTAIAGSPNPGNKELFNTSKQPEGYAPQDAFSQWLEAYYKQTGRYPSNEEKAAYWDSQPNGAETAAYFRGGSRPIA